VFRSHLQPSSRPRELYTKIHKHGFNYGIGHIIKASALLRRVSFLLKGLIRRLRKTWAVLNYITNVSRTTKHNKIQIQWGQDTEKKVGAH